jgi:hypothetical protein
MVVRIPIEKITETKTKLVFVLNSKNVTLRTTFQGVSLPDKKEII